MSLFPSLTACHTTIKQARPCTFVFRGGTVSLPKCFGPDCYGSNPKEQSHRQWFVFSTLILLQCWLVSSTLGFLKFVFLVWLILSVADTWKLKLAVMWTTLNNFLIFLFCLLLFVENIQKIVLLTFYRMSNKNKVWRQQIHVVVLSWWNPKRLEHILAAILLCTLWVQPAKSPRRCQARALDREFLIGKWLQQLLMILSVSESYYHSS